MDAGQTRDYQSRSAAVDSPLALKLFAIEGVTGVFLGADSLTINISEEASWLIVKPNVFAAVMDFFATYAIRTPHGTALPTPPPLLTSSCVCDVSRAAVASR